MGYGWDMVITGSKDGEVYELYKKDGYASYGNLHPHYLFNFETMWVPKEEDVYTMNFQLQVIEEEYIDRSSDRMSDDSFFHVVEKFYKKYCGWTKDGYDNIIVTCTRYP